MPGSWESLMEKEGQSPETGDKHCHFFSQSLVPFWQHEKPYHVGSASPQQTQRLAQSPTDE